MRPLIGFVCLIGGDLVAELDQTVVIRFALSRSQILFQKIKGLGQIVMG